MIKLALVDDGAIVRSALASLLSLNDDLTVVAEYSSGEEAVENMDGVDVAILDLQLGGIDGIETAQALMASGAAAATMILTSPARPGY